MKTLQFEEKEIEFLKEVLIYYDTYHAQRIVKDIDKQIEKEDVSEYREYSDLCLT